MYLGNYVYWCFVGWFSVGRVSSHTYHGDNKAHKHKHIKPVRSSDPEERKEQFLANDDMMHDLDHMMDDYPGLFKHLTEEQIEHMSPSEKDYHYFRIHDYDENQHLDGLELLSAISHVIGHDDDDDDDDDDHEVLSEEEMKERKIEIEEEKNEMDLFFIELIDKELEMNDQDHDGMLSYREYLSGRRRDGVSRLAHALDGRDPSEVGL